MSNIKKLQAMTSPAESIKAVGVREKARRRAMGITQQQLSERSGVSLGTIRRFEQTGQIALESLLRISRALECESEIDALFVKPSYKSIQEVIDEQGR